VLPFAKEVYAVCNNKTKMGGWCSWCWCAHRDKVSLVGNESLMYTFVEEEIVGDCRIAE
jgi:hypothetical protein